MNITTIGVDLAKSVFQVHGVNKRGKDTANEFQSRRTFTRAAKSSSPIPAEMARLKSLEI